MSGRARTAANSSRRRGFDVPDADAPGFAARFKAAEPIRREGYVDLQYVADSSPAPVSSTRRRSISPFSPGVYEELERMQQASSAK